MTRNQAEEFIQEFFAARLAHDPGRSSGLFADDGIIELAGSPEDSAIVGRAEGRGQFEPVIKKLIDQWHWHSVSDEQTLIDGSSIAVMYTISATHTPTGEKLSTRIMDLFQLDEAARVTSMTEFVDTALADRLAAASPGG